MARGWRCALAALIVAVPPVAAQTPADSAASRQLKAIIVQPYDVFAPGEDRGFIAKALNGLHFTTKPWVVRREILLDVGQDYDSARVAESARALRALGIFRRVDIDSIRTDSGLVLRAETQDAFSTLPQGAFTGSLGAANSRWWVALNEMNLLGTAARLGVSYRRDVDRDAFTGSFSRNRLIDGRIGVSAIYDQRSDGHMVYGATWLPFASFTAPSSWLLSFEERNDRILRYYPARSEAPRDSLRRRLWMARAGVAGALDASSAGYLRVGVDAQLRRDDYALPQRIDTLGNTITGAVTPYLTWRAARFLVSRDFEGFGRQEDVDLSTVVTVRMGLTPKIFGYRDDGVVPQLSARTGLGWRNGFAILNLSAHGRFTDAVALDSGSVHVAGTMVVRPIRRHLAVFHAAHGWQENPMPGGEFDLGVGVGPRGFSDHSFTGTRAFMLSTEYRYLVADDFFGLAGIGVAGFADYGGAWYPGERRRTGYALGVGLRFGVTVATDLAPGRLDLTYRNGDGLDRGGWRVWFGKGFVFNLDGRLDR